MTEATLALRHYLGENFPLLSLDRRTRDALAAYVAHRWPSARRKSVGREWGLSDDEARSVCNGRASWATFDKILQHKNGGWKVLFPVFGAILDQTAEQYIIAKRKEHAEHARRLGALVADPWLMRHGRGSDPDTLDSAPPERRVFSRR